MVNVSERAVSVRPCLTLANVGGKRFTARTYIAVGIPILPTPDRPVFSSAAARISPAAPASSASCGGPGEAPSGSVSTALETRRSFLPGVVGFVDDVVIVVVLGAKTVAFAQADATLETVFRREKEQGV